MRHLFFILLLTVTWRAEAAELSTSGTLVEEVISRSENAKAWDWRRYQIQIEAGYTTINESNSFTSKSYNIGLSRPVSRGWIARGQIRRAVISGTASSNAVSLTPFSQAAQPSRYEILGGAAYTLLDGRSSTLLSPKISDLGHALYAIGGLQYNYFTNEEPEPIPGMRALYYKFIAEAGLRFQVFLPEHLGIAFDWTYSLPVTSSDPDLNSWQRFTGSLTWSFN
jgi:hypothetical protein